MICEVAVIAVKPGQEAEFETAFATARTLPEAIQGFHGLELRRGVERPQTYLLLAWWDSVEAHTEGFRNAPQFGEWRALLGPFFAGPPEVFHYGETL